jgi:hypothetical protein
MLLLGSCIEDKGSYKYREINTVTISGIVGRDTAYLVSVGDTLRITPTLTFSLGEEHDAYRYEWHQMKATAPYYSERLLSTERNLILPIEGSMRFSRLYSLLYCVTNLTTGVRYDYILSVRVQSKTSKGYIVLHEQSASSFNIDLIAEYGYLLYRLPNILDMFASDLPKTDRKPLDVLCYVDRTAPSPYDGSSRMLYSVWVLTDKSTDRIKAEDYSYKEEYNISKISVIPPAVRGGKDLVAEKMVATMPGTNENVARSYMYFNGSWFFFNLATAPYFFEQPLNVLAGDSTAKPYTAAPYIIPVSYFGAFMFDEDNKRFMLHQTESSDMYNSSKIFCSHKITAGEDYFSWENAGYQLRYMSNRTWRGGFAVVKDAVTGEYMLLEMNLENHGSVKQLKKSIFPPSFDVEAVKHFAYHPTLPYLYCATEDKIYKIYVTAMAIDDVTSQVLPAGHKVSLMKFLFMRAPRSGLLALATYDPSGAAGQNGALSFYAAEDGTGNLSLAKHPVEPANDGYQIDMKWQGFGKIVGLDYKEQ